MMPDTESQTPARRNTLGILLWSSLAVVAAPILYVAARYLRPPKPPVSMTTAGKESEIGAGAIRIVKVGTTDAAILRNTEGELYALNLRCTHAGCNVVWRDQDQSFSCPCHGGRFDRTGEVLKGPPKSPLQQLELRIDKGSVIVSDVEGS